MTPARTKPAEPSATAVTFDARGMTVALADGRILIVPLDWFPRLLNATPAQRDAVYISNGGFGLHWDEIDEDISVAGIMAGYGDETKAGRAARAAYRAAQDDACAGSQR